MAELTEPRYLAGLHAALTSEALEGAVPAHQNSPRRSPYGLYPEQINGTAFTVPRARNLRSWLYRIRPSVTHHELKVLPEGRFGAGYLKEPVNPNLLGWRPRQVPTDTVDFAASLETVGGAGDPAREPGLALHTYAATADMVDTAMMDADGDLMIVPDTGVLSIQTEYGVLNLRPGELALVQRGMTFRVSPVGGPIRGLVLEIYGRHFELPERGVIGANGLSDPRHFRIPTASWEDREVRDGYRLIVKMGGRLWEGRRSHSPFDVVGWHGNYHPFKYDLADYNAMGTVTFDHPDPSIFTVLSAPLHHPGENLADFVVFPNPRWDVAEHTFRPPFYHRNAATELNAIVKGPSDPAKVFTRGGYFYTPPMAAHGVNVESIERILHLSDDEADKPRRMADDSLWVQWESVFPLQMTPWALAAETRDPNFREFARDAAVHFDPTKPDAAPGR